MLAGEWITVMLFAAVLILLTLYAEMRMRWQRTRNQRDWARGELIKFDRARSNLRNRIAALSAIRETTMPLQEITAQLDKIVVSSEEIQDLAVDDETE